MRTFTALSYAIDHSYLSVNLTSNSAGCTWNAASLANWIPNASSASGTGSGTLSSTVSPNTGAQQRTGNITIAGLLFTVTQGPAVGSRFVPIAPCRVGDTRTSAPSQAEIEIDGSFVGTTPSSVITEWRARGRRAPVFLAPSGYIFI